MQANIHPRQRTCEALLFGNPDRIPLSPGEGRQSTRTAWHAQGLPEEIAPDSITEYAYRQAGGALEWPAAGPGFAVDHRMIPQFEEKVIEERKDSLIVQDWKGNICEISKEFTPEYLRMPIDFVTRRWLKCPVTDWDDWEEMKRRYDPDDSARIPEDAERVGKAAMQSSDFIEVYFHGPFWQLREWCGFEGICMFFYDKPKLVAAMLEFWREYVGQLLENMYKYVVPDCVHFCEDMAYKNFSMISPHMVREHLLPIYRHWGDLIRRNGTPIYAMDSDGFIGELIPLWIEAGLNVCDPIEVAAGNDIAQFRQEFGRNMAYRGGIDKRAIAKGGTAIEKEMKRVDPIIQDGGYIPSCDHGVPPDVSWPNFIHYAKLVAKATGWL